MLSTNKDWIDRISTASLSAKIVPMLTSFLLVVSSSSRVGPFAIIFIASVLNFPFGIFLLHAFLSSFDANHVLPSLSNTATTRHVSIFTYLLAPLPYAQLIVTSLLLSMKTSLAHFLISIALYPFKYFDPFFENHLWLSDMNFLSMLVDPASLLPNSNVLALCRVAELTSASDLQFSNVFSTLKVALWSTPEKNILPNYFLSRCYLLQWKSLSRSDMRQSLSWLNF